MDERIAPDVIVLTEAAVPEAGVPEGWSALWRHGGRGPRLRWGTVVAARDCELVEVPQIAERGRESLPHLIAELSPLFESSRTDRLIVAGDFNVFPHWPALNALNAIGLIDLIDHTSQSRTALDGCVHSPTPGASATTRRSSPSSPDLAFCPIARALSTDKRFGRRCGGRGHG